MNRKINLLNWFLGGLILVLVIFKMSEARASGGHDDGGDTTVTTGDVNVGGATVNTGVDVSSSTDFVGSTNKSNSYAIAPPGLGDVDIAQCLGSQAWTLLVGGKQTLVLNQVCMAEFYLKQARYDLAAQALCNQREILDEYDTEVACEIAHDFTPAIVEGEDEFEITESFKNIEEQHSEDLDDLQAQVAQVTDEFEAYRNRPRAKPAPVQQAAPEPEYTDDDWDAVWGALKGGDDE